MKKLTAYLARLFVTDALILFGVVCVLIWLVNCLRSFEVVSVKGQNILILGWQALLTLPPLAISFFYACIGIGLVRALQALQNNRELHIIHTSRGLPSLWGAGTVVAAAGVAGVLLLSNFVEPYAVRRLNVLNASVAADLVSTTLKPGRFTQVSPGVILLIGARQGDGEITEFFADDRRDPQMRRTYIAESAKVSSDGENYVIELRNGSVQNAGEDGRFSEISFVRYDVNVENFSQSVANVNPMLEQDSVQLIVNAFRTGEWTDELVSTLVNRAAEGLRVVGIVLLVMAMTAFPSGRRTRIQIPLEAVVLLIAFAERGFSAYSPLGPGTGAIAMIVVGGGALIYQARPRKTYPAVLP